MFDSFDGSLVEATRASHLWQCFTCTQEAMLACFTTNCVQACASHVWPYLTCTQEAMLACFALAQHGSYVSRAHRV